MKTNFRVRAFFLEPTDQVELSLRRYRSDDSKCPTSKHGYCDVDVVVERTSIATLAAAGWPMKDGHPVHDGTAIAHDDPRWPQRCSCGREFKTEDHWQCSPDTLYRRSDSGELVTLGAAPAGAMWFAPWFSDHPEYTGPDGQTLVVRTPPSHDWIVDSRASNCDSPCAKCGAPYNKHDGKKCSRYEDRRPHKCWIRHGAPPNMTVDKAGLTCGAGGGSIGTPHFHGFLKNGELYGEIYAKPGAAAAPPADPSPYVRISVLLQAGSHTLASLAESYKRDVGRVLRPAELDKALRKGKAKGTFIERDGRWTHASRAQQ